MSSATNHRKRSRRNDTYRRAAFAASIRRTRYNSAKQHKQGFLRGMLAKLKRNAVSEKSGRKREARTNGNV